MVNWLRRLFKKRRKLIAVFIDETGYEIRLKVPYDNNTFTVRGLGKEQQAYLVDNNFTLRDYKTKLPVLHYYVNNPNPIRYSHERNQEVDSVGFKKILDSKTIVDLFSEDGQKKLMLIIILVAANICISLIVMLIEFGVIKIGSAAATGTPAG